MNTTASSPITKPMLADKCERLNALSFPLLATPKLDGIRCLKLNGRALTRSFKPVSNRFIREWIEANLPDGLDGELIVKGTTFNETAGHVGRESGEPDFTFAVVIQRPQVGIVQLKIPGARKCIAQVFVWLKAVYRQDIDALGHQERQEVGIVELHGVVRHR